MPKYRRAIGVDAEGRSLRFALVLRDGKDLRVESIKTVVMRDPLSGPAAMTRAVREAASADPFGIESFLSTDGAVRVDQSNLDILLDTIEQYSEDVAVYAVSCNPFEANLVAIADGSRLRNSREWLAWGRRQGLTLEGGETPRFLSSEGKSGWILFHPVSSPLLELFRETSEQLGKYRPHVRLMEDPRISLVESAALGGHTTSAERVVVLHHDIGGGWLIELIGNRIHALTSLPQREWQEAVNARLFSHESSQDISLVTFSGALEREQVESFVRDRLPSAKIEPLVVLPWDDPSSGAPELLTAFAIPIALAAKALSPRDSRFYLAPHVRFPRSARSALFQPSIGGIAVLTVALLGGSGLVMQHVQQSREIRQLRARAARLEGVTKGQAEAQSLYMALGRGHSASVRDRSILDSLLATTVPLSPVLDTLCRRGRDIGDFWLTDFDWSPNETTISGIALKRENVDKIARTLSGARLMTVTMRSLDGRTVHSFVVTALGSIAAEDP